MLELTEALKLMRMPAILEEPFKLTHKRREIQSSVELFGQN